ncbi:hypothetical protein BG015_002404 [Linnemannia schmuckeri]|uniref:Uncharacterized protein n=1 Tax=Linnemannia schmuckeri TaxID=64567 RepID=A0A9P5RP17_9FUNG|nr:hypothetical protein BG015_002404 [Linnemannia schmuckeri]
MSTSVMNSDNMSTITIQEYRERQREREREREHDHEDSDASNNVHAKKKIRSSAHLPSPPLPTTIYTADDQLNRTSPVPQVSASTLPTAAPTSSSSSSSSSFASISALVAHTTSAATISTTSGPSSPSLNTTASKQKLAHPLQPLTQTQQQSQPHPHAQQQQKLSHPPPTPIYTIDDFITRYACKLHYLDYSIKSQLHKIEAIKNDPAQDQKYRDLYLGLASSEAKVRETEDKIESLFKLKIIGK